MISYPSSISYPSFHYTMWLSSHCLEPFTIHHYHSLNFDCLLLLIACWLLIAVYSYSDTFYKFILHIHTHTHSHTHSHTTHHCIRIRIRMSDVWYDMRKWFCSTLNSQLLTLKHGSLVVLYWPLIELLILHPIQPTKQSPSRQQKQTMQMPLMLAPLYTFE